MPNPPLIVVLPVCQKDVLLAVKNLEWQAELGDMMPHCVVTHDDSVSSSWAAKLQSLAVKCYSKVEVKKYPMPPSGYWPPNWAFKHSAEFVAKHKSPWLWLEPDAWPLCAGWLQSMEDGYYGCGKDFFGPIIPELNHVNGTCVYPHNAPTLLKHGINDAHTAWDVSCKSEMEGKRADCSHLLYHVWTINSGIPHPFLGGTPPHFPNRNSLNIIPPTAVLFHRVKDLSLLERLWECKRII